MKFWSRKTYPKRKAIEALEAEHAKKMLPFQGVNAVEFINNKIAAARALYISSPTEANLLEFIRAQSLLPATSMVIQAISTHIYIETSELKTGAKDKLRSAIDEAVEVFTERRTELIEKQRRATEEEEVDVSFAGPIAAVDKRIDQLNDAKMYVSSQIDNAWSKYKTAISD